MYTTRKALLAGAIALVGLGLASGTAQAFNPQPDPPGRQAAVVVNQAPTVANGLIHVSVNPPAEPAADCGTRLGLRTFRLRTFTLR